MALSIIPNTTSSQSSSWLSYSGSVVATVARKMEAKKAQYNFLKVRVSKKVEIGTFLQTLTASF